MLWVLEVIIQVSSLNDMRNKDYTIKTGYAYTFHRPLSSYINLVIEAGCVVQRVIEPQLDEAVVQQYGTEHARNAYVPQFLIVATTKSTS